MKSLTKHITQQLTDRWLIAAKSFAAFVITALLSAGLSIHGETRAAGFDSPVGSLDLSFGNSGKVITDLFGNEDDPAEVAIQKDGKIIVVGGSINGGVYGVSLVRYNKDGSIDASFGENGRIKTEIRSLAYANAVALQPDGKIVVAGASRPGADYRIADFALVRYNTDGTLDVGFGAGGKVITDFFGFFDTITAVAIQKDNRIVVTGLVYQSLSPSSSDFGLARYNPDGTLDDTFGVGGKVTTDFFGGSDGARGIAIQTDGRLVLAGSATIDSSNRTFCVARYTSDGSLDSSFGIGGKVVTKFAESPVADANDVAIQSDGKILAAGTRYFPSPMPSDFAVVRYNSDGSLDSGFGSEGKVTTDFFGNPDFVSDVFVQPDDKIIAVGSAYLSAGRASADFALSRYNSDGSLDPSFGVGGKIVTDFLGNEDDAVAVAIQSDGNIVVAGYVYQDSNNDSSTEFGLARYVGDSPVPSPVDRRPIIQYVRIQGKQLILSGLNFDIGASILLDGKKQKKTGNDEQSPENVLIARKSGKLIAIGQEVSIQVQNTDGKLSDPYVFVRQ